MEYTHEEERNGLMIKIVHDDNINSPKDWGDNSLFLVGYNSHSFWVEAPKVYRKDKEGKRVEGDTGRLMFSKEDLQRYFSPEKVCPSCESDYIEAISESNFGLKKTYKCKACGKVFKRVKELSPEVFKNYHVFTLSAYIHSGVRLYLGTGKVCQWDSGVVGAVLVSKEEFKTEAKAGKVAEGLLETWNDYLSGNVYGFIVEDKNGNHLESCYGFYGDYEKDGGALVEARSIVDSLTDNGKTDEHGQVLLQLA